MRFERATRSLVLVVAAVIVTAELWAAVTNVRPYARIGYRNLATPNPLVRDADLDPLASFTSTGALVRATQAIPRDATYAIVFGNDPPVANPAEARVAFRFWLQPRRYVRRAADADWVIAYHRSSETLGVRYSREVGLTPGVNVVEVTR
jgi:hypothetical protein